MSIVFFFKQKTAYYMRISDWSSNVCSSDLKEVLDKLEVPNGMGVIIRSNGVGRTLEEIQWDANYLAEIWAAIEKAAGERKGTFLVYQENNIILRALRDYLRTDIGEVRSEERGVGKACYRMCINRGVPYVLKKKQ